MLSPHRIWLIPLVLLAFASTYSLCQVVYIFIFPAKFYTVFLLTDEETEAQSGSLPRVTSGKQQRQVANPDQPDSKPYPESPIVAASRQVQKMCEARQHKISV